jgi:NitT/TauT family transport system permease protein
LRRSVLRGPNPKVFAQGAVGLATVGALLLAWEAAVRRGLVDNVFLPAPSTISAALWRLLLNGTLLPQVAATLERIGVGLAIGATTGLLAAAAAGLARPVEWALTPVVELIRAVPPIALLPAFLLLFGIGLRGTAAIIVWVTWAPVFLNTLEGIRGVDGVLIKAAHSMGSSRLQVIRKCVIPAAIPFIVVGLRLSVGSAFLVVVAAELLGVNTGLGYYILETSQTFKIPEMYAAIVSIGILAFLFNAVLVLVTKRLTPWRHDLG